jgi:hypothetical protein
MERRPVGFRLKPVDRLVAAGAAAPGRPGGLA